MMAIQKEWREYRLGIYEIPICDFRPFGKGFGSKNIVKITRSPGITVYREQTF
jgi:hypothetical protein